MQPARALVYHGRMDYRSWYNSVSGPFRTGRRMRAVAMLDKALVAAIALEYAGALAWLACMGDSRLWRAVAVPACALMLVSVLRIAFDRKRPYERHGIDPLIAKDVRGKSFPSRHVASAAVIAITLTWLDPVAGAFALGACALVCLTRVIGGVHYPTDVAAAIALACAVALVGLCM